MAFASTTRRPTLLFLLLTSLLVLFFLAPAVGLAPRALADDDQPKEEEKEGEGKGKGEHKAGPSFREIFLHILFSVGPWMGGILLLVSIALVTLCVLLVMELRMGVAIPPVFVEEFTDTVNKRRFKEAYEMAKEDPSFVARVLSAGMSRLQYGIDDAREASFSMLESVKAGKEQFIVYLATIGTLGPLLGLVGTVFGMILAFMTMAGGDQIKASELAGAISHALVVTLLGVALSVPAIFAHAFFKNRLTRIAHDAGTVADDLLTQMYYNSKKAGASAAEVSAPPPPPSADSRGAPPVPGVPAIRPK
jgi:biopolymer transport protein ExbB